MKQNLRERNASLATHRVMTGIETIQVQETKEDPTPTCFLPLLSCSIAAIGISFLHSGHGIHMDQKVMYPWYAMIALTIAHIFAPGKCSETIVKFLLPALCILSGVMPFIFSVSGHTHGYQVRTVMIVISVMALMTSIILFPRKK